METPILERHKKQLAVSRGWLEGKGFYVAADALELVRKQAEGTRKDGITPKFHHQLSVARLLTTLAPHLLHPEETIAAAYLHDLLEDHGDEWTLSKLETRYGKLISGAVWTLSKKTSGLVKTPEMYYREVALCPISSVVKPADRAHNLLTMQGVFGREKQLSYMGEVETFFFPMIRQARRTFPKQYGAYENLKILLRCQFRLLQQIHEAGSGL